MMNIIKNDFIKNLLLRNNNNNNNNNIIIWAIIVTRIYNIIMRNDNY